MERANKRARVSSDTNGSSMRKKPHLPPEILASIFNQMEETPLSLSLVNKEWRSLYLKKRVFSLHVLPPKRTDTPATFSNKKKRSGPPAILLNGAQRQFRRKRKALLIEQQSLTPAERRKNQAEAVDMIYKLIKENCFSVHTLDFEFSEIADDHLNKIFKIYLKREELVEGLRPVDEEEEEEEEDQSAEALAKREKRRLEIANDFVGLRWVSLRGCSNITNHALRNMPSTVMYLDISFKRIKSSHLKGPLIDREGFRYLPSKLHTLNLQYSYYVDKRDFQFLPQRLHTLIWTHEGENIPPSHTVTFPKDMTTLQMPISTFADISCLPPKLKKLRPTRIGPNVHEQAFLFCPSTLKKLDFSSCPNDMDGKVLPFLPTALRSLSLADCWKLADVHFFNLPVSLVALDLSRSGATNRTVENIKLSSLTALQKLSLAETEVDDNGIRFINATALRSLDLSLNNVTDAGLPFLPSTLRKLDLSCTDVTSKGLTSYLPRGVTILNVYGCPNLTGDAFYHLPQMKVVNGKAVDVVPKSEE